MLFPGSRYPDFLATGVYLGGEVVINSQDYLRKARVIPRHRKHQKVLSASYRGFKEGYLLIIFYPANFILSAQQNLLELSDNLEEFYGRECRILACSQESIYSTVQWMGTDRTSGGIANLRFPVICDKLGDMCRGFNVIDQNSGFTLPALFIVDTLGLVRHVCLYQEPVSICSYELLRVLDVLTNIDSMGEEGFPELQLQYSNCSSKGNTVRTDIIMKYFKCENNTEEITENFADMFERSSQTEEKCFKEISIQCDLLALELSQSREKEVSETVCSQIVDDIIEKVYKQTYNHDDELETLVKQSVDSDHNKMINEKEYQRENEIKITTENSQLASRPPRSKKNEDANDPKSLIRFSAVNISIQQEVNVCTSKDLKKASMKEDDFPPKSDERSKSSSVLKPDDDQGEKKDEKLKTLSKPNNRSMFNSKPSDKNHNCQTS